jgi:hypothetical protein
MIDFELLPTTTIATRPMNVLVACEYSGVTREAFTQCGHYAWSVDLLPSEKIGNHLEGDARDYLDLNWDLLIAYPPCTHLASSGASYFYDKSKDQKAALAFVWELMQAPIPRIAIENPIGLISTQITKPDQIVQPWQFGHEETKSTCLWLKNLPPLQPTQIMKKRNGNLDWNGQNKYGPSDYRWKQRSRTYAGIAQAMAEQWAGIYGS